MSRATNIAVDGIRLTFWSLLPIALTAAASVLGIMGGADSALAPKLQFWAIVCTIAVGLLLLAKAVHDFRWGRSLEQTRYDTVRELHNSLGPALDMMTEMAIIDPSEQAARRALLEKAAEVCCGALVAMTPKSADVRAVVFELAAAPERLEPIARFGRRDVPRTFDLTTSAGHEIMSYLNQAGTLGAELYRNVKRKAPMHYTGDRGRYRTFIRAPIWANGVLFGMIAVDAPKKNSLAKDDKLLAELVAAELATAFAIVVS